MKSKMLIGTVTMVATWLGSSVLAVDGSGGELTLGLAEELERGVFLEEGKGDLEAAERVYRAILEESELMDSLAAEAKFRLAGIYLAQGKDMVGRKLLKEVVADFPNESFWVAEAKTLLPQEFVPSLTPWHDGERIHYDWKLATGDVIGRSVDTIALYEWEGKTLWRKESRYLLNGNRATAVEFDPETFNSVYSNMYLDSMGNVRAWYGDEAKSAHVAYAKSGQERDFEFTESAIDNEQVYNLMRQFPIEPGYKLEETIFVSFSGTPITVGFEVLGIEKIDTNLGLLECYKVEIDLVAQKQYAYITTDERRLIVRFEMGGVEGVISKVETVDYDGEILYEDSEYDLSLRLPASWSVIPHIRNKSMVMIAQPMARGEFAFARRENSKWDESEPLGLEQLRRFFVRELKDDLKQHEYVEDWEADLSLAGLETAGIKFVYKEGEQSETAYGYVAISDDIHFFMLGRIPASEEDELLPIYQGIVNSLKLGR